MASLPVKDKKKKRSFFEDDDFFVMKKNKKAKSPVLEKPSVSLNLPSPTKPQTNPPPNVPSEPSSGQIDSDDLHQSFHSAHETFSDDQELPSAPIVEPEVVDLVDLEEEDQEELSDDPDTALSKFFKGISLAEPSQGLQESERQYIVKIMSVHSEITEELQVPGDRTFESMVREILMKHHWHYNMQEDNILFWVEGRSELKGFFKPSTLRIPPATNEQITKVTVFHTLKYRNDDLHLLSEQYEHPKDAESETEEDGDDTLLDVVEVKPMVPDPQPERAEYFIIGLKGKDNKRIECEVGSHTKISDMLAYYLKVKGIDPSTVDAKLIFDDEVLSLDGTVGDTELEEDFEVQVHI